MRPALGDVESIAADWPDDPAGLLEALHTWRLWPWSPGDAAAPWFTDSCSCVNCARAGAVEVPVSISDVAGVAALGVPMLLKVAAAVRETSERLVPHGLEPIGRIMWRVGVPLPISGPVWTRDDTRTNPPP